MSYIFDKAGFAAHIYRSLMAGASLGDEEIDGMRLIQMLSGILTETLLLFESPDDGLESSYQSLALMLGCEPEDGNLADNALPPSYIIDYETEQGRGLAKLLFEDWLDCAYDFHQLILFVTHNVMVRLDEAGQPKSETFRLFIECTNRAMGYEIAAQELCDIVIDRKICDENWSLAEGVSGLSAIAGRFLALSHSACEVFSGTALPDKLDQLAYVMTQEAIRLGIPAGTDWRFGLAANDGPVNAPHDLVNGLDPHCRALFAVMTMTDTMDCAVACAKAAGRMLALTAGGEKPEVEPVIAKPLAMAAMTETYRSVCFNPLPAQGSF